MNQRNHCTLSKHRRIWCRTTLNLPLRFCPKFEGTIVLTTASSWECSARMFPVYFYIGIVHRESPLTLPRNPKVSKIHMDVVSSRYSARRQLQMKNLSDTGARYPLWWCADQKVEEVVTHWNLRLSLPRTTSHSFLRLCDRQAPFAMPPVSALVQTA